MLGYTKYPTSGYNLKVEQRDEKGSRKADGALYVNEKVAAVIELKGTDTTDLDKVEQKAFGYKNYHRHAQYVIISNFEKLLSDIETSILENNLFGVDINEESVEIAKLSLWLRTAQKGRKLTSLNNHINCGNSLIDDPEVAGEKAFNWEEEFPSVFQKKKKQAFHVTWVTHNARTSQRMIDYKVKKRSTFLVE